MRKLRNLFSTLLLAAGMIFGCGTPIPAHAQATFNTDKTSFTLTTSGQSVTYTNIKGILNFSVEEIFTGAPATVNIVITGKMHGGTTQTLDTYTTVANSIRSITGFYEQITITASWTGGTAPTAIFNLYGTANSAPSIISFQYVNITTLTSTVVKTGPGFFHAFIVSTKGATANQAVVFDNTTCTGTKIATIDTTAQGATYIYDVSFNTGLCILTQTGTAGDFTVSYR